MEIKLSLFFKFKNNSQIHFFLENNVENLFHTPESISEEPITRLFVKSLCEMLQWGEFVILFINVFP